MGFYMDNNVVIASFYQQLNLKVELKPQQIESQVGGTFQSTRNSITRRTARVMANWALSLQEEYAACRAPFSTTINHARGRNEWERTLIASPKFFSPSTLRRSIVPRFAKCLTLCYLGYKHFGLISGKKILQ